MPTSMLPQILQPTQEAAPEGVKPEKLDQLKEHLKLFWADRYQEIEDMTDYRQRQLPLARIKRVMKSDESVKMISADVPFMFAKACGFFILEITDRSWLETEGDNRRTLQRADIANAIRKSPSFVFLRDIVPIQHHDKDHQATQVQGQHRPSPPNGPPSSSGSLIMPNSFNGSSSSNVPNWHNVVNGLNVPNNFTMPSGANIFPEQIGPSGSNVRNGPNDRIVPTSFIVSSGSNGYNVPNSSNVQNDPNGLNMPSSFIVPSGENGFNGLNSPAVPNGTSYPMMAPSFFQPYHNVPLTNNVVQFPMMTTNQFQMNCTPVDVEGFYRGNMGAQMANGMFYSPMMNSADQFHQKFYVDNQVGSSNCQMMIERNEADIQVEKPNGVHFSCTGRNRADIQVGTSNGTQFSIFEPSSEAGFQAGILNCGRQNEAHVQSGQLHSSMYGSNEAQFQNEPSNFVVPACTDAEPQIEPLNFGVRNEQQCQFGKGAMGHKMD